MATPRAPNPYQVAGQQQQYNIDAALAQRYLNQYEEVTPYGSSRYEPTGNVYNTGGMGGTGARGGTGGLFSGLMGGMSGSGGKGQRQQGYEIPEMRRVTEFSPEQQRIFEAETGVTGDLFGLARGMTGRVAEGLSEPFSYEGLPEAPRASEEARQQVIDSLYGQYTSRLDPQFERNRQALEQRLVNRGIPLNSDAYRSEMERFGRTRNDAYTSALNQAVLSGGAEQSRLFGLQGAARERAIQELVAKRQMPLNELTALMSGRGVTLPQFTATPQSNINPADLQGAVYNSYAGKLKAHEIAEQARASLVGSLAGAGGQLGAAAILSDRRAKTDIRKIGKLDNDIPVYRYRYKGDDQVHIGPMAQDVEKKRPQAVGQIFGLKTVDLNKAVA